MASRIIWSPRATSHLEGICEYIAKDSLMYSRIFAQQVTSIVKNIPQFPKSGRIVPEYDDPNIREKSMAIIGLSIGSKKRLLR